MRIHYLLWIIICTLFLTTMVYVRNYINSDDSLRIFVSFSLPYIFVYGFVKLSTLFDDLKIFNFLFAILLIFCAIIGANILPTVFSEIDIPMKILYIVLGFLGLFTGFFIGFTKFYKLIKKQYEIQNYDELP